MIRFISVEAIQRIQADSIATYGGSYGLRDVGLLESALDRAVNRHSYQSDSSMASLAAALGWGLIKNHAFIDGNKRIGLAAVITFLSLNGCKFSVTAEAAAHMTIRVAAGDISEDEWSAWVEDHTRVLT